MYDYNTLLLYFIIWYFFTCVAYGTYVPAGLFLPGILIGCSLGRMVSLFIHSFLGAQGHPTTYAIIGAATVLAGYTRLSFSLAVIMLETTENVNLFLPITFGLLVSFAVGRMFNRSMYMLAIRTKHLSYLTETVPSCNAFLKAHEIMSSSVHTFPRLVKVSVIGQALKDHPYNGFPIVDKEFGNERVVGLINRHTLMCVLAKLDLVRD